MSDKAEWAYRTISEVSEHLDVPAHVLRFWETKFTQLKPMKRSGGRRYYKASDMAMLERIRDLLYRDGFTIKGAQKALREKKQLAAADGVVVPSASAASNGHSERAQKAVASDARQHSAQEEARQIAIDKALGALKRLELRLDAMLARKG